jgi:enoyl-CoA hydratase/carnithine racemase
MTTTELVLSDGAAPVRRLSLNRPKARNALSLALMEALEAAISDAGATEGVRAIVLAAEGPAFCAGHDLREMAALREGPDGGEAGYRKTFETCVSLMTAIMTCPVPVIARVQGMATAAGCQLVATCDLAVASTEARFATPGVNIGLFCSTPMVAMSRNVARKQAMEMLLTGDAVSAEEAHRIGLVNRVVAPEALDDEVAALADKIASKSGRVLRIGKEAFYRQLEMGVSDAYRYTAEVMTRNMMEDDAAEGIGAFIEKRDPKWSDH